jgi:hypothetical protein
MEVVFDVSAVPLTEEQINAILTARAELLKEDVSEGKREDISVMTSIAFGEERRFVLPGNGEPKEYESAQAMIADQPPLPDPVFSPGQVVPCTYDAGAQLNCLDAHEASFKEMIQEMFEAGPELKLTEDAIDHLVNEREKTDRHYQRE